MTAFLSVVRPKIAGVFPNPWQRLADDWPEVVVVHADLRPRWAETCWYRSGPPTITLHSGLTQVRRRCALAHELEHLDRGQPCQTLRASIERRVLSATAEYLLPDLEKVAEALAVYPLRQAAHELWVTWQVLVDRLNGLTDEQSEYVHRRQEGVA